MLRSALPYMVGIGATVTVGIVVTVLALSYRSRHAVPPWLREPQSPSRGRVRTGESRPALPVASGQARALPARSVPLSAAPRVLQGQVIRESADAGVSAEPKR